MADPSGGDYTIEDTHDTYQTCGGCRQELPLSSFPLKVKGPGAHTLRTKTCQDCTVRKQKWRAEKGKGSQEGKENVPASRPGGNAAQEGKGRPEREITEDAMSLPDFLKFLGEQARVLDLEARVSVPELRGFEADELAKKVAILIWEKVDYRFM